MCVLTTFYPLSETLFWTVPTLVCRIPHYFLWALYPAEGHSVPHSFSPLWGPTFHPGAAPCVNSPCTMLGPAPLAQDHSSSSLCPGDAPCCPQTLTSALAHWTPKSPPSALWVPSCLATSKMVWGELKKKRVDFLKIKVKLNKHTLMINTRLIDALIEIKVACWPSVRTQNTDDSPIILHTAKYKLPLQISSALN